jgi:1,4-alpha-glucan branching enzyme
VKKTYLKSRPACKVTFRLPKSAAGPAKRVHLVGDFNDWAPDATPLAKQKDGSFAATLELPVGRAYCFRYLVDGSRWENDWGADRYEPCGVGNDDNSVVVV